MRARQTYKELIEMAFAIFQRKNSRVMKLSTYLFILSGLLLISCEEYYNPKLEDVTKIMVVDSHITNNLQENFVRISRTRGFNSTSGVDWVSGAVVELVQENFQIIKAREDAPGYYVFPATPVSGNKYRLRITHLKDVYESDYSLMPAVPSIDSLYTVNELVKTYRTNAYNVPELYEKPVRQVYIDAPATTEPSYYRFKCRSIIQWVFNPFTAYLPTSTLIHKPIQVPDPSDTSFHVLYGWISETDLGQFNLAGPKEFSNTEGIIKHPIVSLAYNSYEYLDSTTQESYNWILILDQYGIPKESYDYHQKLNRQLSSDGSLFDPIMTQVYGNIHCKTDPDKLVLGFFDLNSVRQYRYYLNLGSGSDITVVLRELNHYYDIPERGFQKDKPPVFWETDYK